MRKCYEKLGAIAGFKKLRESNTRILATWDDHDMGANDAGGVNGQPVEISPSGVNPVAASQGM